MELTPEERRRIYEEEKAKEAASNPFRIDHDQLESTWRARRPKRIITWILVGLAAMWVLGTITSAVEKHTKAPFQRGRAEAAIVESAAIAELRERRVLHGVGFYEEGIFVAVGPAFYTSSFGDKVVAIRTVAAAVGEDNGGDHFILYDWSDNRKVGAWRGEDGLALFK